MHEPPDVAVAAAVTVVASRVLPDATRPLVEEAPKLVDGGAVSVIFGVLMLIACFDDDYLEAGACLTPGS